MKQLFGWTDLIGRVIEKIEPNSDSLYIKFDDDSVVVFEFNEGSQGFEFAADRGFAISTWSIEDDFDTLYDLSFITEEEWRALDEKRQERYRMEEEEVQKERKDRERERDLKLYNELKAKYGK